LSLLQFCNSCYLLVLIYLNFRDNIVTIFALNSKLLCVWCSLSVQELCRIIIINIRKTTEKVHVCR
jgi:hypothetical protein